MCALKMLELDQDAGADDYFACAQVRKPIARSAIPRGRIGAAADAAGRRAGVAAGRRHAARTRPVRHAGVAERGFGPPGNPVLGHVLQIELRVPLKKRLPRLLREIRRAALGRGTIDRWRERQIAAGIVDEPAAERYGIQVIVEPGAVIELHAEEVLFVSAVGARDAAAVLAADIKRVAEGQFGYACAARSVRIVIFHLDTVVFVDARHPRVVDRRAGSHIGPGRGVPVAAVLRLAVDVDGSAGAVGLTGSVVLADRVAVEDQFQRVVGNPEYLPAETRLAVEFRIGLPAVDEPGFDLQILSRPPLHAQAVEEPRRVGGDE